MKERFLEEQSAHARRRWVTLGVGGLVALWAGACQRLDEVVLTRPALTTSTSFRNGALPRSSYAGGADSMIRQAEPGANFDGLGTCEADGDDGGGTDKSCLLRWDVTDIPTGAHVDAASITLQVVNGTSNTYPVFALERSFEPRQATWNQASSAEAWWAAGALAPSDRGNQIGTISAGTGSTTVQLDAAGVALVQSWVDGSANHGVIIASDTDTDGIDFVSSDASTVADRPTLNVTYTMSGGTGGHGGSGGSMAGVTSFPSGDSTSFSPVDTSGGPARLPTDPNLLVAFIGDQGNNGNSSAVLELIAREGAHAVVHNGDFDYEDNPTAWENRIDGILGPDFPYFAVVGNHDAAAWDGPEGYSARIAARHARVPDMVCTGELGVQADCRFRGLHLIESCVGTYELRPSCAADSSEQVDFIRASLARADDIFSVCNWHKNQHDMQVGRKSDEVGWNAYQACMSAGAIIATGHEHSYSRTLTLTDVGNVASGHGAVGAFDFVELDSGKTFAFVSGIAGRGIRAFSTADHDDDTWWASAYASDRWLKNGVLSSGVAAYGALFIEFHVDGNQSRARAYFKDINGRMADEFTIQAR